MWDGRDAVPLGSLGTSTPLSAEPAVVAGRTVLIATRGQLTAGLACLELDGIADRMILLPSDLRPAHLADVVAASGADAVVYDDDAASLPGQAWAVPPVRCTPALRPRTGPAQRNRRTEWILLTSGTTGTPKLARHTLASLAAPIGTRPTPGAVWSTFYDIRRYGGLTIFLRAVLGQTAMVLSDAGEPIGAFLRRAGSVGVTHISGTPTHWRRALMSGHARDFDPRYIRLSGEIADASILAQLRLTYPAASIAHAFASTEAGVGFAVDDGRPGFPACFLDQSQNGVELCVRNGTLHLRSANTASGYLGRQDLADADGFIDTGDLVERCGDRFVFAGRRDGTINVGGSKVSPEGVEAVINGHPAVRMSLAKARRNPFTGAVVVAQIVLRDGVAGGPPDGAPGRALAAEIIALCRRSLAPTAVPASVHFVDSLPVTAAGKLERHGG